jgi:hypothetical protein
MASPKVADPFEDLLPETAMLPTQTKKAVDQWEGPIPSSAAELAITAYEKQAPERRVILPCSSKELAAKLHSAIKAAVVSQNGHLTMYSTHVKDDEGNITHFSFVVGKPRGRNKPTAEEN